MKRSTLSIIAAGSLLLSACGNKTDVNEENFGAAMSHYLEKTGLQCLKIDDWPYDVAESDFMQKTNYSLGLATKMAALNSVGLATYESTLQDGTTLYGVPTGRKIRMQRYSLTDAAKPFVVEKTYGSAAAARNKSAVRQDLCWGKLALDRIVKWKSPSTFGNHQSVKLAYTYKVINLAPWASNPEVRSAFPAIEQILDGANKHENIHVVVLKNDGWEAKGLDW